MPIKPYLLLDAGGTLVFPDQQFLMEQIKLQDLPVTHSKLFEGYCRLIYNLDHQAQVNGFLPSPVWPNGYVDALLSLLDITGPAREAIVRAGKERHRRKNLWTFTFDWVPGVLERLAGEGYRMSVISNSDGRTEQLLAELNLASYFERIFDSRLLDVEKPDPTIFQTALAELSLPPQAALYVGDVFYLDVVGANSAGLGSVHLDPAGLYQDWPGVHLPDLRRLPDWLSQYEAAPEQFDLFPAGRPAAREKDADAE